MYIACLVFYDAVSQLVCLVASDVLVTICTVVRYQHDCRILNFRFLSPSFPHRYSAVYRYI